MSRSVLVVDDDAIFRRLIGGILSGWGHTVVGEAAGVQEALARAVELRPDTALVDILGAVGSIVGVGITSVSSAASSGLPTLTLTLNGRSVGVSGALQSGAVNVVSSVSVQHTEPVPIRLNPGVPFSALPRRARQPMPTTEI